jgi:hypothetical protein
VHTEGGLFRRQNKEKRKIKINEEAKARVGTKKKKKSLAEKVSLNVKTIFDKSFSWRNYKFAQILS